MFFAFILLKQTKSNPVYLTTVPTRREEMISFQLQNASSCLIYISKSNSTKNVERAETISYSHCKKACKYNVTNGQYIPNTWRSSLYVYAIQCNSSIDAPFKDIISIKYSPIITELDYTVISWMFLWNCGIAICSLGVFLQSVIKFWDAVQEGNIIILCVSITWAIHAITRLLTLLPIQLLNDISIITGVISDTSVLICTILLFGGVEDAFSQKPYYRVIISTILGIAFSLINFKWSFDAYYEADFSIFIQPVLSVVILITVLLMQAHTKKQIRKMRGTTEQTTLFEETTPLVARAELLGGATLLPGICFVGALRPLFYGLRTGGSIFRLVALIEACDTLMRGATVMSMRPRPEYWDDADAMDSAIPSSPLLIE